MYKKFGSDLIMKGLTIAFTLVIVALTVGVFSQDEHEAQYETAEVAHGHRSKRSPDGGLVPALLLGKSFLLGSLLGPKIFKNRGWGWAPRRNVGWGWSGPVHSSGWSSGRSWSSPVVTVSHGWGW